MIWVRGEVVPDDALRISVLDRTFEHGLGLFETLRTWNGHATLLDRHLSRMRRSASELKLPLDPEDLPDAEAVAALLRADGREGDAALRITMSGGLSETRGSVVWMRTFELPPPTPDGTLALAPTSYWPREEHGRLAGHKTLNAWAKRIAYDEVRSWGWDEALIWSDERWCWEGTRTNLFLIEGNTLLTPRFDGPRLPGIMSGLVLERAPALGLEVRDIGVEHHDLIIVDEVFLTNAVRGIIPVGRFGDHLYLSRGPWTRRLWDDILPWLESGGTTS